MLEMVTLELPDTIVRHAKAIAEQTGRPLQTILTEWLARGEALDENLSFQVDSEYPILTPYGNETAAEVLFQALKAAEANNTMSK